jgi:hypothetical protein
MKITLSFLLLSLSCFSQTFSFPKNTPLPLIVAKLFDGKIQAGNPKEVVWKPNTAEYFRFGVSDNGLLYTVVDTTFSRTVDSERTLIIATATYKKSEEYDFRSCHTCGPVLSLILMDDDPKSTQYRVRYIMKYITEYGTYSAPDDLSLLEMESGFALLVIDWTRNGQGESYSGKDFYFDGQLVFSVTTHAYNDNVFNGPGAYEYDTAMAVNPATGVFTFTEHGTAPNAEGKVVTVNQTTNYRFDANTNSGIFEKLCE